MARRKERPPRRYFRLTAQGDVALAEALERYKSFRVAGKALSMNNVYIAGVQTGHKSL